jgi:hypothetical protein
MIRKPGLIAAGMLIAAIGIAQLKPRPLVNPPVKGDLSAPPEIEAILRQACYDCHSNQSRWPWYSHIAPFSWVVAHHVNLGRKEIDFSEWGEYFPSTRKRKLEWIRRALHEEIMPPWSYRLMHPDSWLSDDDRAQLEHWIDTELVVPAVQPSAR